MSANATKEEEDEWPWERRRDDAIVVTVWTLMLLYAFVSNVLILLGIMRSQSMRQATSYWFIISLALCDIVMTLISLLHLVPATAFHSAYVQKNSWRNIWVIFFYDLFWYTAVLELGVMAINRFASIVYPMDYKRLFSPRRTTILIILLYSMGMTASLPTLFPCCHTLWNADYYITEYYPSDTWFKYVDIGVNSLALLLMVFCYIVILFKVRESSRAMAKYQLTIRQRQEDESKDGTNFEAAVKRNSSLRPPRSQVSKKEMRLFIQFFIVSVVFLLTWTTWQWLPHMSDSKWAYFVMTSLFFINNSINPTVYLIFNTQLRRQVQFMLCKQRAIAAADARRRRTLLTRQRRNNNNHTRQIRLLSEDASMCNGSGGPRTPLDSSHSNSSSEFVERRKSKKKLLGHADDGRVVFRRSTLTKSGGNDSGGRGLVFENKVIAKRSSSPEPPIISTNISTV